MARQEETLLTIEELTPLAKVYKCHASGNKLVRARVDLSEGQLLSEFSAKEVLDQPTYLSVQINDSQHISLDPKWLQCINHSCDPNVFFDTSTRQVIVLKPIQVDTEIAFFYPSTEWSMEQPFECLCNSHNCLGKIQGSKFLSPDILVSYKLSDHIQNALKENATRVI